LWATAPLILILLPHSLPAKGKKRNEGMSTDNSIIVNVL